MELRQYWCNDCNYIFWVDCDADDYPDYCPYCGMTDISKTTCVVVCN